MPENESLAAALNESLGPIIPDVGQSLNFFINLSKVIGVLALGYIIFLAIRAFLRARAMKDIRVMKEHIIHIDRKMDKIIELMEGSKKSKR